MMNNMLIFAQDGKYTCFCRSIAIGARNESGLIGDSLKSLLDDKGITIEELIKNFGNSYRDAVNRILNNQEIPNEKMLNKLVKFFDVDEDYFKEKELQNVIITDNGIIVGQYDTNARALEIKTQLDELIKECYQKNRPIVLELPKE